MLATRVFESFRTGRPETSACQTLFAGKISHAPPAAGVARGVAVGDTGRAVGAAPGAADPTAAATEGIPPGGAAGSGRSVPQAARWARAAKAATANSAGHGSRQRILQVLRSVEARDRGEAAPCHGGHDA